MAVVRPGARQLQPRLHGPRAEHATPPDEHDVVVAGAADGRPDEERRLRDPLAGSRGEQRSAGDEVPRLRRLVGRVVGDGELVAILAPGLEAAIDPAVRQARAAVDDALRGTLQAGGALELDRLHVGRVRPVQPRAALASLEVELLDLGRSRVVLERLHGRCDVPRVVTARARDGAVRVVRAGVGDPATGRDPRGRIGAAEGERDRLVVPAVRVRG